VPFEQRVVICINYFPLCWMDKICVPTPRLKFKRMSLLEQKQRYTIEILQNDNYSQTDIVKIICRNK